MTLQQGLAFALVGCAIALFIWGRFRYDLVSLGVLVVGVAIGVVKPKEAFDGFSNDVVVIIAAALVISSAVARAGVIEQLIQPLVSRLKTERAQVPALVGSTTLLSMATKNVGALAILMPVAIRLSRLTGTSISRLLMPMSFASLLGGLVTLVGTSPNILVSEVRQDVLGKPFGMFDFTPVGLSLAVIGSIFLCFAYRILPKDRVASTGMEEAIGEKPYLTEAKAPEEWPEGRTVADLKLGDYAVNLAAIVRKGDRMTTPLPDAAIHPGDTLVLEGQQDALDQAIEKAGLKLARADAPVVKDEPADDVWTTEAVISPDSVLVGRSVADVDMFESYGVNLLAVSRSGRKLSGQKTERLRASTLRAGDVVVIQGAEKTLPGALQRLGCLPLVDRTLRLGAFRRRLAPIIILAVAMVLVATRVVPVAAAFFGAAVIMIAVGALTMREAYQSIDGKVLVLIAALLPVSEAIQKTGGADLVAHSLAPILMGVPPMLALGMIVVAGMAASPFLHNAPTVLVLGPIAASLATSLHLSPDAFLMAVATGAACDFLTPIGHQCNTLVMGPGGYRFSDYWRLGAPLSLLVAIAGPLLIAHFWPLTPAG